MPERRPPEAERRSHLAAAPARSRRDEEEAAGVCSFWFVRAAHVRACPSVTLPTFQELRKQDGALCQMTIGRSEAYGGALTREYCTVSHRWLDAAEPDRSGDQLRAVQAYLACHPEVKFVWYECVWRLRLRTDRTHTITRPWVTPHVARTLHMAPTSLFRVARVAAASLRPA